MKKQELLELITELSTNTELTKKERNSLASKIKKQYAIMMRDLKYNGKKISIENLRNLINPLTENYDNIKELNSINEMIQTIIQDYDIAYIENEKDKNNLEIEKEKVHAIILGNPGTTIDGMSSEYISKIIKRKLTEEEGINRDDIINILNMQSRNMYLDIEEYQNLINNSVISYLSYNQNADKFKNPKILEVFQSLASSYKIKGDFDKVQEIYELALKIKTLEKTPEYEDLKESYQKFLDFLEMKRNFEDRRFDSFEDLMNSLKKKFTNDQIFVTGTSYSSNVNTPTTSNDDNYIMPVKDRLEGIKILVNALKKDNNDYDILECEVGQETYDGYIIFKIENTNISILEYFKEENARIFFVKNEMIDEIKPLAKNTAIALDGVEGANHIANFDNYVRNIVKKARKLIRETQIGLAPPEDDEIQFDDDEIDISDSFTEEPEKGENIKDNENEHENIKKDYEEMSKIEVERKKAFENREKLQKLKQKLAEIQRNKETRINNVLNKIDSTQEDSVK